MPFPSQRGLPLTFPSSCVCSGRKLKVWPSPVPGNSRVIPGTTVAFRADPGGREPFGVSTRQYEWDEPDSSGAA